MKRGGGDILHVGSKVDQSPDVFKEHKYFNQRSTEDGVKVRIGGIEVTCSYVTR